MLAQNRKRFSKYVYKICIEYIAKKNVPMNDCLQAKWIGEIRVFKEGTMQKIGKASMSTALMYLHFKILNRIYGTNKYLCKIGSRENSLCCFCETVTETIVHLFWQCPIITQIFIKEVLSHLKDKYSTYIEINSGK